MIEIRINPKQEICLLAFLAKCIQIKSTLSPVIKFNYPYMNATKRILFNTINISLAV